MIKTIGAFVLLTWTQLTCAALPPDYQNMRDIDVMVSFVKERPRVLATLKSIDFNNRIVHFGNDCQIKFGRKPMRRPLSTDAPEPLEFSNSTCDVD